MNQTTIKHALFTLMSAISKQSWSKICFKFCSSGYYFSYAWASTSNLVGGFQEYIQVLKLAHTSFLLSHLRSWHSYWKLQMFYLFIFQNGSTSKATAGSGNHSVWKTDFLWGCLRESASCGVDSQGLVTHAHAHKQGFGPLEKITLIIAGCIWTYPQWGTGGGLGLTEKTENHIRWCIPACCVILVLSFPSACMEISTRWRVRRVTDATLEARHLKFNKESIHTFIDP